MNKVKNKYVLHLLLAFVVISCNSNSPTLNSKEYVSYLEDASNGFTKKTTTKTIIYQFQFKTPEYIALKEGLQGKELKERIKNLDSSVWFNIKIIDPKQSKNPLKKYSSNISEYNVLLDFLNFRAQDNFNLLYKGKGQERIGYYFENSYGVTPYETIIIGFKLTDNIIDDALQLTYNDELFQNGIINFTVTKQDILNKPILKF